MTDEESNDIDIPMAEIFDDEPADKEDKQESEEAKLLGQMLIQGDFITVNQLESALQKQVEDWQAGKESFLGQILVEQGSIKQEDLVAALVKQTHLPFVNLLFYEIDQEVLNLVPKEICQKHSFLPLDKLGRMLTVAMCNPADSAVAEIFGQLHPNLKLKRVMCAWPHFHEVFQKHFGQTDEPGELTLKNLGRQR